MPGQLPTTGMTPPPSTEDKGTLRSSPYSSPPSWEVLSNSQPDGLPSPGSSFPFRFLMAQILSLKPRSGPLSEHVILEAFWAGPRCRPVFWLAPWEAALLPGKAPIQDTCSSERLVWSSEPVETELSGSAAMGCRACWTAAPSNETALSTVVTPLGSAGQGQGWGWWLTLLGHLLGW